VTTTSRRKYFCDHNAASAGPDTTAVMGLRVGSAAEDVVGTGGGTVDRPVRNQLRPHATTAGRPRTRLTDCRNSRRSKT